MLDAVERLTGARCDTCPLAGPRLPWVRYAAEARTWAEWGQLELFHPAPPRVLIDAITLIGAGVGARQMCEIRRAKARATAPPDPTHE